MRRRRARVAVVEEFALVAETFGLALGEVCDSRSVLPTALSSTLSVAEDVVRVKPDLVFVDADLGPHVDPALLVEDLAQRGLLVVVLTNHVGDEAARGEYLRRGAIGALYKAEGLDPVVAAFERALADQPVTDPEEARHLIATTLDGEEEHDRDRRRLDSLSKRERVILKRLMAGTTVTAIARSSFVSEATVRTQIKSILVKLDTNSQIAAVAIAYTNGWVAAPDDPTRTKERVSESGVD